MFSAGGVEASAPLGAVCDGAGCHGAGCHGAGCHGALKSTSGRDAKAGIGKPGASRLSSFGGRANGEPDSSCGAAPERAAPSGAVAAAAAAGEGAGANVGAVGAG